MTATIDHAAFIRASEAEATGVTSPLKRALRRVLEQPGDDTARLWYADELDAVGGGERAEFIRNQCGPKRNLIATAEPRDGVYVIHGRNGDTVLADALEETVRDLPAARLTWSRGFISRIECTLEVFMGGECPNCESFLLSGYYHSECSCHGTGRTPGLVDTLFSDQPIEAVILTDREPHEVTDNIYFWSLGEVEQSRNHGLGYSFIPRELWVLLTDMSKKWERSRSSVADYPTRESALLALSAACVSLGRKRAGLPELKPTEVTR